MWVLINSILEIFKRQNKTRVLGALVLLDELINHGVKRGDGPLVRVVLFGH